MIMAFQSLLPAGMASLAQPHRTPQMTAGCGHRRTGAPWPPKSAGSESPMPKLAANLSMMFQGLEFLDRFEAAAKAGFRAVEFLFPYEYDAAELRRRLDRFGLVQVLFNLPPGDWAKGERGMSIFPERIDAFAESVGR